MRRKLLIGLATAGLFLGGFGGAVLPASAEPHHFLLELANGVSVPWTGEPGAAPTSIAVAGVSVPVVSVQDLGAVAEEAVPTVETPPPPPAPAPPAPAPKPAAEPSAPAPSTSTSKPSTTQAPSTTSGGSTQPQPKAAGTATRQTSSTQPKAGKAQVAGRQEQQETIGARRARKSQAAREGSKPKKAKKAEKAKARKPAKKTVDPATDVKTVDAPPAHAAPPPATNPSFSLAQPGAAPVGVPNFFIDKFRIPPFLLPIYQAAGVQYGIRWEVLAAINEIETDYGRNLNISSAGEDLPADAV